MEINKVSVVEHEHMAEMEQNLKRKLKDLQTREASAQVDSIKTTVLNLVVSDQYDSAKDEIRAYIAVKTEYPLFQGRAERYAEHCCELIQAIKTKRNFPGLANLALAKQQDMHEKILVHFDELKRNLNQIEKIEREQKLLDMRSTVWILKTLCFMVALIVGFAFMVDLQEGLFSAFFRVTEVTLDNATTWVVSLIGFS